MSYAHKVLPSSFGAYSSGTLKAGQMVNFTGAGSHDNDAQDDFGETPYWIWDFQYDGTTFVDRATTYEGQLAQWTYSQPGTYTIAVIYTDDDGQQGNTCTFQVTIAPSLRRYYYVKDHLGSIRVTVNETGGVVSWDDYDPWGMQLEGRSGTTVSESRYKFTEKERDVETGYDYFGARYYDSCIAKWMSVDPDGRDWYNMGSEK